MDDGMARTGDVINVQNSVAKQLKDQGVVEFVGEENDEQAPEPKTAKNSVTISDEGGKKVFDSGKTAEHVAAEKAKPSNVTESKKSANPKEK